MPEDFGIESSRTTKRLRSTNNDAKWVCACLFFVCVCSILLLYLTHYTTHTRSFFSLFLCTSIQPWICARFCPNRIAFRWKNRFHHLTHSEPYQRFIKYNWNTLGACAYICARNETELELYILSLFSASHAPSSSPVWWQTCLTRTGLFIILISHILLLLR